MDKTIKVTANSAKEAVQHCDVPKLGQWTKHGVVTAVLEPEHLFGRLWEVTVSTKNRNNVTHRS